MSTTHAKLENRNLSLALNNPRHPDRQQRKQQKSTSEYVLTLKDVGSWHPDELSPRNLFRASGPLFGGLPPPQPTKLCSTLHSFHQITNPTSRPETGFDAGPIITTQAWHRKAVPR